MTPSKRKKTSDPHEQLLVSSCSMDVVVAEEQFVAQKTLPFPKKIPVQYPFPPDQNAFYVRECYAEYYNAILNRFRDTETRGVSITGTSGIGKSVFLACFFLRLKLEPAATIILIAYSTRSDAKRVAVWRQNHLQRSSDEYDIRALASQFKDDPQAIFLLDGPPDMEPPSSHRYVVCANPETQWFLGRWKDYTHVTMYMAPWRVEELVDAVDKLALTESTLGRLPDVVGFPRRITSTTASSTNRCEEVLYRFAVFGGVARACLGSEGEFLERQMRSLLQALATVDMATGRSHPDQYHWLYHHVPIPHNAVLSSVQRASCFVTQRLRERLCSLGGMPRIRSFVEASTETVTLYRAILLDDFHARLLRKPKPGVVLTVVALEDHTTGILPSGPHRMVLPPRELPPPSELPRGELQLSQLSSGLYAMQEYSPSLDLLYVVKPQQQQNKTTTNEPPLLWDQIQVVLLQVAVSRPHVAAIQAKSLLDLLQRRLRLPLMEIPQSVALVSLVPQQRVAEFVTTGQRAIRIEPSYPLTSTTKITAVDGITSAMVAVLNEHAQVYTVGDLRRPRVELLANEQLQQSVVGQAQELLRCHENAMVVDKSANDNVLQQIPQFVAGM